MAAVCSLREFARRFLVPSNRAPRILGVDYGDRRTGLAVTIDPACRVATALTEVARPRSLRRLRTTETDNFDRQVAVRIGHLVSKYEVSGVVVGWPLLPDGSQGDRCTATLRAIERIQKHGKVTCPIVVWDERYSSRDARQTLADDGVGSRGKQKRLNQLAAELILQSFLNAFHDPRTFDHPESGKSLPNGFFG